MISARRGDGPTGCRGGVSLFPPLREVLAVDEGFIVAGLPIAGHELVAVARRGTGIDLLSAPSLKRDRLLRRYSAGALDGSVVFGWPEGKSGGGSVPGVRVLDGRPAAATIAVGDLIVGKDVVEVRAWNCVSGRLAWEWVTSPSHVESGSGNTIRTDLCSDGERVYFGMRDGTIRALSVRDGKEVWRTVLVKNPDPFKSEEERLHYLSAWEPVGSGSVVDGVVYFHAANRVVALDAVSGGQLWVSIARCLGGGQFHRDSYHCLGFGGEYEILDARTGRRRFKKDLTSVTPASFHNGGMPTYMPMVISDSHMFCGYGIGYLLAFERTTGRLVWHKRASPPLSFHHDNYFQIVNGRLYTGDYGTMRIYEEVNATDPVLIQQRAEAEAAGEQGKARRSAKAKPKPSTRAAAKKAGSKKVMKTRPTSARRGKA